MELNREIFRQYDIRGEVGKDLTDETVSVLGRAVGSYLCQQGAKKVSLASDNRLSSDGFRRIFAEELSKSGLQVLNFGVIPTPVFYFTLFEFDVDGGVMITGSHNPPEFNGFKIASGKSTIYGEEIQRIREIAEKGRYTVGKGSVEEAEATELYVKKVSSDIRILRNLKIAIDCGNGTAGIVVPKLLEAYNVTSKFLYCEPDGHFPNHHPDPTVPKYLEDLIKEVREGSYDVGIAYDGDADRIGVIDEKGDIVWGDRLLIIFSRDILSRNKGAKIIFEVKCSQTLIEAIEKAGGVPVMWKTGHSLIKSKMKQEGALLAGEMSGHIFFNDRYYGFDDAIYASLRLLEILSARKVSVSNLLADVPHYFSTPEVRIDFSDKEKFEVVKRLTDYFRQKHKVIDIDGVRVLFDEGWGLVRASNTQPILVLRFEAKTQEALKAITDEVTEAIHAVSGKRIDLGGYS